MEGYAEDGAALIAAFSGLRTKDLGWTYRLPGWLNRGLGHQYQPGFNSAASDRNTQNNRLKRGYMEDL